MSKINIQARQADHVEIGEPEFLKKRVNRYYAKIPSQANGGHPFINKSTKIKPGSVMLCTNDYLSICTHPDIVKAHTDSLLQHGNGLLMSTVFQSEQSPQRMFELNMASFLQKGDVLLCQSGWAANVGLLQSITDKNTPVYIDLMSHLSLWEGIKTAGATPRAFRHNNIESLEKLIHRHGRGVIIVDALYSTHGDIAPLVEIADLSKKYGCIFVVDESHSLATHGLNGEGLIAELGINDKVDFITASLGKGFAGRGGIIAGSKRHIEYIRFESTPTIFSTAVQPHEADAFSKTIEVVKQEHWRRSKLKRNADYLRAHLSHMGYNVDDSQSQIIALEVGSLIETNKVREVLESKGVIGAIFLEPATAKNRCLIRLTVTAELSREQLNHVASVCYTVRKKVDLENWSSTKRKNKKLQQNKKVNESQRPNHLSGQLLLNKSITSEEESISI